MELDLIPIDFVSSKKLPENPSHIFFKIIYLYTLNKLYIKLLILFLVKYIIINFFIINIIIIILLI